MNTMWGEPLVKLGAVAGCVAALAVCGAAQAKTVDLGTIDSATTEANSFAVTSGETVVFEFTVDAPYVYTLTIDEPGSDNTYSGAGTYTYYQKTKFGEAGEFSYSLTTAVPEPMTWALMVMGVGGLGAVMRRQRKFGSVATAMA